MPVAFPEITQDPMRINAFPPLVAAPFVPFNEDWEASSVMSTRALVEIDRKPLFVLLLAVLRKTVTLLRSSARTPAVLSRIEEFSIVAFADPEIVGLIRIAAPTPGVPQEITDVLRTARVAVLLGSKSIPVVVNDLM